MFLIKFPFIKELVYGNGQKTAQKSEENDQIKLRRSSRLRHRTLTPTSQ